MTPHTIANSKKLLAAISSPLIFNQVTQKHIRKTG
jgi:hypothetical protein